METAASEARTQRERSETTTKSILKAARTRFAKNGYEGTSLDEIVTAAGVTKGALYHHFQGKRDVFRAVFEREQRQLGEATRTAIQARADPWDGLYAGVRALLQAALDPGVQRIALLDAPAVLGWESVREIEATYTLAQISECLRLAMASGRIARRPVEPLAYIVNGIVTEGALVIARSEKPTAMMRHVIREVRTIMRALETG